MDFKSFGCTTRRVGVAVSGADPRFLVPQYEGGCPAGCCAAYDLNEPGVVTQTIRKATGCYTYCGLSKPLDVFLIPPLNMPTNPLKAALVAGETSGDLLAGLLLDGMKARWPELSSFGIGGPQMARRGFEAWWPHDKLSVHGFGWDVLLRYREIIGIRNQLKARLLANPPDVFIGVDAPDFNLTWKPRSKGMASRRCTLSASRSGLGGPSGWKKSNAVWIMCCASFRLSPPCWRSTALPPPMLGIRWRR